MMAPEVANSEFYSHEVDIWSLGIILYQLYHGLEHPWISRDSLVANHTYFKKLIHEEIKYDCPEDV